MNLLLRAVVFLLSTTLVIPSTIAADDYSAVEEMMFAGNPRPAVETISIWNRDIPWRAATKNSAQLEEIRSAVADMNSALHRSPFKLVEAKDSPPALVIEFVSPEKLSTRQGKNRRFRPGRVGNTITFKRGDASIGIAAVYIADNLPGRTRQYVLRHELMHAIGVPKHATYVFDSIMRSNWRMSAAPVTLLDFDRKLVDFVYNSLKSGFTKQQTKDAFDRDWYRSAQ